MLTEDEAETRWCPFANVYQQVQGVAAGNRGFVGGHAHMHNHTRCIGSACMAWRWVEEIDGIKPSNRAHGRCGLAGP